MKKPICFIISFGHDAIQPNGLKDPGAKSGKFVESRLTKKVAKYMYNELKSLRKKNDNFIVVFPEKDMIGDNLPTHREQVETYKRRGYRTVFIDVHFNAFNENAEGVEALCQKKRGKTKCSTYLGNNITKRLSRLGFTNRGVKYDMSFQVMKFSGISVIAECGFLDNRHDQKLIDENRELKAIGKELAFACFDYYKKFK